MSDALNTLLDYPENHDKGHLHTCSLIRDDDFDRVDCSFSLDRNPGVEYTFRHPISTATEEGPLMGPNLNVSIFISSIMEGTRSLHGTRTEAVDGKISLN